MSSVTFEDQTINPTAPGSGQMTLFVKNNNLFSIDDVGTVIDYSTLTTQFLTEDINLTNTIGFVTVPTLADSLSVLQSAGLTVGGAITQGVGQSVDVATGTGAVRTANDETSTLFAIVFPAKSTISVPTDTDIFIGVRYNAGTPEIFSKATNVWNYNDEFPLGTVANTGGSLTIVNDPHKMSNLPGLVLQRLYETDPFAVDLRTGGFRIGDSADSNRFATMTAGALWDRLNRIVVSSIDTSGIDTFSRFFKDGIGGFTEQTTQNTWDNGFFDDGTGTLNTLTASFYAVQWVWLDFVNNEFLFLYGTAEYSTIAAARNEKVPADQPEIIEGVGRLLGRFIVQQGNNIAVLIENLADFSPDFETVTNHGNLAGLMDDDHPQYSLVDGTRAFTDDVTMDVDLDVAGQGLFGTVGTPGAAMILEVRSTTGAFILSRMTTAQRNAFTGVNGMMLYNTSLGKIQGFSSGSWTDMT